MFTIFKYYFWVSTGTMTALQARQNFADVILNEALCPESFIKALCTMKAATIAGARKNDDLVDGSKMYRVGQDGKTEILIQSGK